MRMDMPETELILDLHDHPSPFSLYLYISIHTHYTNKDRDRQRERSPRWSHGKFKLFWRVFKGEIKASNAFEEVGLAWR